jgi:hypothetical protein
VSTWPSVDIEGQLAVASNAVDVALGHFLAACRNAVVWDMRPVVEGAGGSFCLGASLFGLGKSSVLPLYLPSPPLLLFSLGKGHWCHFTVLHEANLHPQLTHCHCGVPSVASSATFWCSHLVLQQLWLNSSFSRELILANCKLSQATFGSDLYLAQLSSAQLAVAQLS